MHYFPFPPSRPLAASEPPALVRVVGRQDVLWNRPVFKAPPLVLQPKHFNATLLAEDLRRIGMVAR